ncbi:MAG: hypothetical protein R3B13_12235 [Polyangiaceae bacterium]
MALLKTRPELKLYAPSEVRPGDSFIAEVVVNARRPVPVDRLSARLIGEERVTIGSGKNSRTARKRWLSLEAQLSGKSRMVGERRYRARFDVPADVPPSYKGCQASIEYWIELHADIPWWPDARASFVIPVVHPAGQVVSQPLVFSSRPSGPKGKEPHIEASIDDAYLSPGGVIEGRVALSNVDSNRYYGIQVHLRGKQTAKIRRSRSSSWCFEYTLNVPLARAVEGEPIPFRMRIPAVPPSQQSTHFSLEWVLEVRARRRFAMDEVVGARVVVVPADSQRPKSKRVLPPSVGSPRVAALWQAVAAELGLRFDGSSLQGRVNDTEVQVVRDSHDGGTYLTGTLTFEDLGLGLDAGPLGGFSRYVSGEPRVQWPNDRHYFTGRDLGQVEPFAKAWLARNFPHELVDADDQTLVIQHKGGGRTAEELKRFTIDIFELARNLAVARAQILAPTCFSRTAVQQWQRLAAELGSTLRLGDMSVVGTYEGRKASVLTVWSERAPAHTRIELEPQHAIAEREQVVWSKGEELPGTRREVRAAFERVCQGALECKAETQRLCVAIPAPLRKSTDVFERLAALVDLELALLKRRGYR